MRFSVETVSWPEAQAALSHIRRQVFMLEQQVPAVLEWDGLDEDAVHLLASAAGRQPIGCTRILAGGSIGRMAVLSEWRGHGVGKRLLQMALAICAQRGWQHVSLSAQTHAIGFYAQAGFRVCSEEYLDAGMPHRNMQLALARDR